MDHEELGRLDVAHLVHPVTALADHEKRGPTLLMSGRGAYVRDAAGRELIDGFSGLWCVNVGYSQPAVVAAATRQLETLPYGSSFSHFGNAPSIQLAAELAGLTPDCLEHVFFTVGGSDAVETALKIARYYHSVTAAPERRHFIALERGYHGSAFAGAGVTALPAYHGHFGLPLEFQHHIPSHDAYRNPAGPDSGAIIRAGVDALESCIARVGAERVAAFIVEPVQGAGGVVVPPVGWLSALREVCAHHGILFIADEVITGFGRTGRWFACDHEDLQPDLMAVAKGLTSGYAPMGATLMTEPIYRALVENVPDGTVFGHGFTYSGHPVSASVALSVLELYRGGLVEQVQRIGPYFQERLATLRQRPFVGNVRGMGLLGAIELVRDPAAKTAFDPALRVGARVHAAAYRAGVLCRAMGDTLGFAPPYVCEEREIDLIVDRFAVALDEVGRELQS